MSETSELPKTMNKPTICPYCMREFDVVIYPEIHIPGDNRLKKKILNKTLFQPTCPFCKEEFKLKATCMFRDDTRFEIIVVSDSKGKKFENLLTFEEVDHIDKETAQMVKTLYKRRVVYDIDAFREKILLSDYNYDDRIMELMKLSLSRLLEKDTHQPVYRIFLEEASGNQLVYTAIMGSKPDFEYITIKTAANTYNRFRDDYLEKLGNPRDDEYINTDQEWARKVGLVGEDEGFVIPYS